MMRTWRRMALVIGGLLVFTACGVPPEPAGQGAAPKVNTSPEQNRIRAERVDEIARLVPQSIRDRGELIVGVNAASGIPPLVFHADDDRTVIGVEVDIAQLVADTLGLRLRLEPTSWENLFLAAESGRYDVVFSNVTVTEERKDKYDFATYRVDTIAFEVKADRNLRIAEPKDIAGLTLSVSSGTNQEQIILRWDERNRAAGLPAANFQYYEKSADYYLALQSGRIDAHVGPYPTSSYHAAVSGQSKVVGQIPGGDDIPAQIAAMTKKGNGGVEAFAAAINAVIGNGKYGEVLDRWKLREEAIPSSEVNPKGLPRKK